MKIAITADVHLTTRQKNPERFHAFEDILQKCTDGGIQHLVIAGDLFEESIRNYADFEALCSRFPKIEIHCLRGNHDVALTQKALTSTTIRVVESPLVHRFSADGFPCLFVPYFKDKTMGELIALHADDLPEHNWILIGHGDWTGSTHEPNPREPGVYMPLTRVDIESFRPAEVILGHIHKPMDRGKIHYVGSPCGIDITDTGHRRFFIVDDENARIQSETVDTDILFFNETLIILPVKNEQDYIKKQIAGRIKNWELKENEVEKVRVQVRVLGYTADKQALFETVKQEFGRFAFHKNAEPDLSAVSVADDLNRAEIANRAAERIARLEWPSGEDQPEKDEILLQALQVIYGD